MNCTSRALFSAALRNLMTNPSRRSLIKMESGVHIGSISIFKHPSGFSKFSFSGPFVCMCSGQGCSPCSNTKHMTLNELFLYFCLCEKLQRLVSTLWQHKHVLSDLEWAAYTAETRPFLLLIPNCQLQLCLFFVISFEAAARKGRRFHQELANHIFALSEPLWLCVGLTFMPLWLVFLLQGAAASRSGLIIWVSVQDEERTEA